MKSWLERAREASNLTASECASVLELPEKDYLFRENRPGTLTLNEIRALRSAFNGDARRIMWSALQDFKP